MADRDPKALAARVRMYARSRGNTSVYDELQTLARAVLKFEEQNECRFEEVCETLGADCLVDRIGELEQEATTLREQVERLRGALGMDTPWPLPAVLDKLIEAGEILLRQFDYDGHGWETIDHALTAARKARAALGDHEREEKRASGRGSGGVVADRLAQILAKWPAIDGADFDWLVDRHQAHLRLIRKITEESVSPEEAKELRGQIAALVAETGTLRGHIRELLEILEFAAHVELRSDIERRLQALRKSFGGDREQDTRDNRVPHP